MEDIEVKGGQRGTPRAEETWTGPTFSPAVDIFETDEALVLVADLPGVPRAGISIDLEADQLTIAGETAAAIPTDETVVSREFEGGRFVRRFALSAVIDQSAISASSLAGGVLRLTLPKVRQAQPRKIRVETT